MNRVVSTFLSDVFERSEPNLDEFKVDVKSLDFSEIVEFGIMVLYVETLMLSSLMRTCQSAQRNASSEYIHQIADKARAIVLQMDNQVSFLAAKCLDLRVDAFSPLE
ncbi:hypothetical protein TSMEX_010366 [Taenia solium]|eukprot:TsM_000363300 transcript=TsM_000363300 gene=TsM_000363300